MTEPVLLLDVDGVIADCSSAVHAFAENLFKRQLPHPDGWHCWDHPEAMGLTRDEAILFNEVALVSKFPQEIALYPGARESVLGLLEHFSIVFVTSRWFGNQYWVPARDQLLQQFACPVIYTDPRYPGSKSHLTGLILLDDRAATIEGGGNWTGVLLDRSYNKESKTEYRVKNLWELIGLKERLR